MGTIMKVDELKFVDEPPARTVRQPSALDKVFAALADHQDRWAVIAVNQKATLSATLRRSYPDYEIISRSEKQGAQMTEPVWSIWACYRGAKYQLDQAQKRRERAAKKAAKSTSGTPTAAA